MLNIRVHMLSMYSLMLLNVYNLGIIRLLLNFIQQSQAQKVLLFLLGLFVIFTHDEHIYYPTLLKVSKSFLFFFFERLPENVINFLKLLLYLLLTISVKCNHISITQKKKKQPLLSNSTFP